MPLLNGFGMSKRRLPRASAGPRPARSGASSTTRDPATASPSTTSRTSSTTGSRRSRGRPPRAAAAPAPAAAPTSAAATGYRKNLSTAPPRRALRVERGPLPGRRLHVGGEEVSTTCWHASASARASLYERSATVASLFGYYEAPTLAGFLRRVVPQILPERGRRRRRGPRRDMGAPLPPRGAARRERLVAVPHRRRGCALERRGSTTARSTPRAPWFIMTCARRPCRSHV